MGTHIFLQMLMYYEFEKKSVYKKMLINKVTPTKAILAMFSSQLLKLDAFETQITSLQNLYISVLMQVHMLEFIEM